MTSFVFCSPSMTKRELDSFNHTIRRPMESAHIPAFHTASAESSHRPVEGQLKQLTPRDAVLVALSACVPRWRTYFGIASDGRSPLYRPYQRQSREIHVLQLQFAYLAHRPSPARPGYSRRKRH
jgi:hypothetical protein